jgi:GT2 family glycosyltransferase
MRGVSATVVVPSYRRPSALRRCLDALTAQTRQPDQVVVALQEDDAASAAVVDKFRGGLPVECAPTADRRAVAIMEAGASRATGEIVAFTDDDAAPRPDWLAALLAGYTSDDVGGVGGRDVVHEPRARDEGTTEAVGRVQWFGRVIHNHHRGAGEARDVDVLKGVNMSLRRELWRFDHLLRGRGMQLHWELELCLRARSEGWRLRYDPAIVVDHHRAPRVDEDPRSELTSASVTDWVHNELYAVLHWSPRWRRAAAFAYAFVVGNRNAPGPLLLPERLVRERDAREVLRRARAGARGRRLALRTLRETRRRPPR